MPQDSPSSTARAVRPSRASLVERVTLILDAFQTAPGRLLLEDVAAMTALPRSTAFRIMGQLIDLGWLEHDSRGYRLGARTIGVQTRSDDHQALRTAADRVLNGLFLQTGSVVYLAVLDGGMVHYLDKLGGRVLDSISSRVGARLPADTTPMGRAMLATLSPERVEALVSITADHPRRAPVDLDDLHTRLAACRRRGYDVVRDGGPRQTITAIGASVHGRHGMLASIGVACSDGQIVPENVAPALLSAARRLTSDIGGTVSQRARWVTEDG